MSTHPQILLRAVVRAALIGVLVLPSVSAAAFAAPSNARIEAARKQANSAREKLDELSDELEERTEEYLEIEDALAQTRRRISATEIELEQALADLAAAEGQLNDRASSIYRNGKLDMVSVSRGCQRLPGLGFANRSDAAHRQQRRRGGRVCQSGA